MSQSLPVEWFVIESRVNAALSWILTGLLVLTAAFGLLNGRFDTVVLAGTAVAVALVPAVVRRSWTRTVPWPILFVASFPLVFATSGLFLDDILVGIGVSALALLVVVALQITTTVRMTPGFAIFFVFLVTLATAGYWAVTSAVSARYLGTAFVETNEELMIIFTAAAVAGLVAGGVFRWYFRRRLNRDLNATQEEVEFA
jgi:hypothetical protein